MGNVGFAEVLVIAVIGLLVFGPRRLPEMARTAGRALHEFKRVTGELTEELKAGLDEPPQSPAPPPVTGAGALTGTEILPMENPGGGRLKSENNGPAGGQSGDLPPGKDV